MTYRLVAHNNVKTAIVSSAITSTLPLWQSGEFIFILVVVVYCSPRIGITEESVRKNSCALNSRIRSRVGFGGKDRSKRDAITHRVGIDACLARRGHGKVIDVGRNCFGAINPLLSTCAQSGISTDLPPQTIATLVVRN